MAVEFFCVVAVVLKRHPELQLNETLDTQKLMNKSIETYAKEKKTSNLLTAKSDFEHEAVSTTSLFFAKSTVHFIMYETNIVDFMENKASSVYECPIQ